MSIRSVILLFCMLSQAAGAALPLAALHGNASAVTAMEHCAGNANMEHHMAQDGQGQHDHSGKNCTMDCQMCIAPMAALTFAIQFNASPSIAHFAPLTEAFLLPEFSDLFYRPPIAA